MTGVLAAIYISPAAGVIPHEVQRAKVVAGRGLEGDRYALGTGTFSSRPGIRDVTLIEEEALAEFAREYGQVLTPAECRRNLVTSMVRLNPLVGREFFIGSIAMRGLRLCEPCAHLARLTPSPVLPGLIHRGGLYAEVLEDGELTVGDVIRLKDG